MTRLPLVAAAVLAISASAPLICATTSPASAQGWRDRGWHDRDDMDGGLRELLRDRIRTREDLRDFIGDVLRDREDLRGRLRERMGREEDEDDGGWRGRFRERLGERIAERRRGREGDCYFLTRSLRDEDGDFLIIVRRRMCRD